MKFLIGLTVLNTILLLESMRRQRHQKALLLLTIKKQRKMSDTMEQKFNDVLNEIDTQTTTIGNDLLDLKDQIKKYGLPEEVEINILDRLQKHADTLKAMASSNASPVTESPVTESPVTDQPLTSTATTSGTKSTTKK